MKYNTEDFNQWLVAKAKWAEQEIERRKASAEELKTIINKLPKEVAKVEVSYNGSGDSGNIDEVNFYDIKGSAVDVTDKDLIEFISNYTEMKLPDGWEIDDGSSGTLLIDVKKKKAKILHSWNETTTRDETFEV